MSSLLSKNTDIDQNLFGIFLGDEIYEILKADKNIRLHLQNS
jgi:hypothetical protein